MNYSQKVTEGKYLLKRGIFPDEILINIRNSELRKEVSSQILYPQDEPKYSELSKIEKDKRSKRLKIELAFINQMHGLSIFNKLSTFLLFIGLIMLVLSAVNKNGNLPFGIITVVEGFLIYLFTRSFLDIIKNIQFIFLIFAALIILELIVFKIPNRPLTFLNNDILSSKWGAILKIINLMSPLIYIALKIVIWGVILIVKNKIQLFNKAKNEFENKSVG